MRTLLGKDIIREEVYNEILENLYDEFQVWRYNRIQPPGVKFRKKKIEKFIDSTDLNMNVYFNQWLGQALYS